MLVCLCVRTIALFETNYFRFRFNAIILCLGYSSGFLTRINDFSVYPTKTVNIETGGFLLNSTIVSYAMFVFCLGCLCGVCSLFPLALDRAKM